MASGERTDISVVVPICNGRRFLAEALDSIFAQTRPPLEVIAADDGSTDDSQAVVARYGERVHWLGQAAGPAATRNLGLRAARGNLLAFLEPGDRWHPDKLERQVARFQARPGLDLCLTHLQPVWTDPEEAERHRGSPRAEPIAGYAISTLLARRRAFEQIGPFSADFRLSDTTDWFVRAAEAGLVFELLPDVLVYSRVDSLDAGRRGDEPERDELLEIVQAALARQRAPGRPRG
jgi:glycosyltransferase involved in cell wall biosynthesis